MQQASHHHAVLSVRILRKSEEWQSQSMLSTHDHHFGLLWSIQYTPGHTCHVYMMPADGNSAEELSSSSYSASACLQKPCCVIISYTFCGLQVALQCCYRNTSCEQCQPLLEPLVCCRALLAQQHLRQSNQPHCHCHPWDNLMWVNLPSMC